MMSVSCDWKAVKYQEIFEQESLGLQRRRKADPLCTPADIEGVLKNLYITDGADWYGRGEVQDITLAATIAAYESFIAQWKAEGEINYGMAGEPHIGKRQSQS